MRSDPSDQSPQADPINTTCQPGFRSRHLAVFRKAFNSFGTNGGTASAGNLAFLTMLALFPFLIFLISLSGLLGQTDRGLEAIDFLMSMLPIEVALALNGPVYSLVDNTDASLLTVSILFALWTASNGIEAARDAVVRAYGQEYAPALWLRRLESLGLVIIGALANILAMTVLVMTPVLLHAIASVFPDFINTGLTQVIAWLVTLLGPMVLFAGLMSMYLTLTPRRVSRKRMLPGTIVAILVFMGTARGFSTYLQYADTYDVTYGSLAGVIVTQLFCFCVAIGFVFGAELNAAYASLSPMNSNERRKAVKRAKAKTATTAS